MKLAEAIGQKILYSFDGFQPPKELLEIIQRHPIGGLTLFRHKNIQSPAQVRRLTASLQAAAAQSGQPALLIAADQEGGQLMAVGEGATPFPGNLALGATGSEELSYRAGYATGRELAAMGINVNYAPVCDVNINPLNPVVGTRSFGDNPLEVARLASAQVRGFQAAGVAAAAKHFPGHGDTAQDSHHGLVSLPHSTRRIRQVELPPFETAIKTGVQLVMIGHIALPAFNNGLNLPSTLSPTILQGLLRQELGFQGLIVSDSLAMQAIRQGDGLLIDAVAAAAAGIDLLLLQHPLEVQERVYRAISQAAERELLSSSQMQVSARRVLALKAWLSCRAQPGLEVVGCAEHRALALEIARKSVTLVRDLDGRFPLRLGSAERMAVIIPKPKDLTPADTSAYVKPALAEILRQFHPNVDEFNVSFEPGDFEIANLKERAVEYGLLVIGTLNAADYPAQLGLVRALINSGTPTIVVALRMPYDLAALPEARCYACTYSIQPPSMQALAEALFGRIPWSGRLPVAIPGINQG